VIQCGANRKSASATSLEIVPSFTCYSSSISTLAASSLFYYHHYDHYQHLHIMAIIFAIVTVVIIIYFLKNLAQSGQLTHLYNDFFLISNITKIIYRLEYVLPGSRPK
jgi:type II secretory pathway component PulF